MDESAVRLQAALNEAMATLNGIMNRSMSLAADLAVVQAQLAESNKKIEELTPKKEE